MQDTKEEKEAFKAKLRTLSFNARGSMKAAPGQVLVSDSDGFVDKRESGKEDDFRVDVPWLSE